MDSLNVISKAHSAVKLLEAAKQWVETYDLYPKGRRRSPLRWWNLQLRWCRKALADESIKGRRKRNAAVCAKIDRERAEHRANIARGSA